MADDRPDRARLTAFVRWALHAEISALQFEFNWPAELLALARCFEGYDWALAIGPGPARVIGISRLRCRPPYELARIDATIFEPHRHVIRTPKDADENPEYYLIVDLLNGHTAHAYRSMLKSRDQWYLLDEHRLPRTAIEGHLRA